MAQAKIPILVKHMALAIYKDDYLKGEKKVDRVYQSLLIARSRLVEYGFLKPGSEQGGPENIKMTPRGARREQEHLREWGGKTRTKQWDQLYKLIQEAVEEESDEGAMDPDAQAFGVPPRTVTDKKKQIRHAKAAKSRSKPQSRKKKRTRAAKVKKVRVKKATVRRTRRR